MKAKRKPILCLDFDGVLHSYSSGWQGPRNIPDPPVDGAIAFLVQAVEHFDVQVFSSRSRYPLGRWAIKRWIRKHAKAKFETYVGELSSSDPEFAYMNKIGAMAWEDWKDVPQFASRQLVRSLKFPLRKPPAFLLIDDRAMRFEGHWPDAKELLRFKPWNRR